MTVEKIRQQLTPERTWVICGQCDEGYSYHDCGEDTCCCLNPEPNVRCDTCEGKGGWYIKEYFGECITEDDLSQIIMARERREGAKKND